MFQAAQNNIVVQHMEQRYKENYIADMVIRTLFSNDVNISECHKIIELVKEKLQNME